MAAPTITEYDPSQLTVQGESQSDEFDPAQLTVQAEIPQDSTPGPTRKPLTTAQKRTVSLGGPRPQDTGAFAKENKELGDIYTAPILPISKLAPTKPTTILGGVTKGAAQVAEGLTTPGSALLFGAGPVIGVAGKILPFLPRAISAAFTVQMLKDAVDESPEVTDAIKKGDYPAAAEHLTKMVTAGYFARKSGEHAAGGPTLLEALQTHNEEAARIVAQESQQPTPVAGVEGPGTPIAGTRVPMNYRPSMMAPNGTVSHADVIDPDTGEVLHSGDLASVQDFIQKNSAPEVGAAQPGLREGAGTPPPEEFKPEDLKVVSDLAPGHVTQMPSGKYTVNKVQDGYVQFTLERSDGTKSARSLPEGIYRRMVAGATQSAPVQQPAPVSPEGKVIQQTTASDVGTAGAPQEVQPDVTSGGGGASEPVPQTGGDQGGGPVEPPVPTGNVDEPVSGVQQPGHGGLGSGEPKQLSGGAGEDHGRPVRRVTGSTPIPLSPEGHEQAAAMFAPVAEGGVMAKPFTWVIPGPLERTQQTAAYASPPDDKNQPTHGVDYAFAPARRGAMEGQPADEAKEQISELLAHPEKVAPGVSPTSGLPGESQDQFEHRLFTGLNELRSNVGPEDNALVVTSGGNLQAIDAYAKAGFPADFKFDHEAMSKQPYWSATGKLFRLEDKGLVQAKDNSEPGLYFSEHSATSFNPVKKGETASDHGGKGVVEKHKPQKQEELVQSAGGLATDSLPSGEGSVGGANDDGISGVVMEKSVIPGIVNLEIFQPIISSIPIDVVNMLGGKKRASEMLLHNPTMLADRLSSHLDRVSDVLPDIQALLPVVALSRAELSRKGSLPAGSKYITALDTFHRELSKRLPGGVASETTGKLAPGNIKFAGATAGAETPTISPGLAGKNKELGTTKLADSSGQHALVIPQTGTSSTPKIAPSTETQPRGTLPKDDRLSISEGTSRELLGMVPIEIRREVSPPMLDIKRQPTGWKKIDLSDGVALIHPTEDTVIRFEAKNRRKGTDVVRAKAQAQAYAIDNSIGEADKVPSHTANPVTPQIPELSDKYVPPSFVGKGVAKQAEAPTMEAGDGREPQPETAGAEQPVHADSGEPLAEQLPEGSSGTGETEPVALSSGESSASRKPRKRTGARKGPELESGGGTVSGVVGDPAEPERTFPPRAQDVVSTHHDRDYRIPDGRVVSGSPESRAKGNIEAIRTLREIQQQERSATVEEQEILAQYVGWGAVPQLFAQKPGFEQFHSDLKSLLTEEEFAEAKRSTTNAHYTSGAIVDLMWKAVEGFGAKPGMSWLEPAVGVGNFFGRQPQTLLEGSRRVGLDKDALSAQIAKLLYPDSGIDHAAFEEAELPSEYFDGAISNIPFGNFGVHDPAFRGKPFLTNPIHNYFFAKALNSVRPGGVVAFVTSRYTMDNIGPAAINFRRWVAEQAHLIGAVRLPSGAFRQSSGTDVITDLIFLRKKIPGETQQGDSWLQSPRKTIPGKYGYGVPIETNEYFQKNPEMVLGKEQTARGQFSDSDYDVSGSATPENIAEAIAKFPGIGFENWKPGQQKRTVATREIKGAEGSKLGGLFFDDNGNLLRRTSRGAAEPMDVSGPIKQRIKGQLVVRDALSKLLDAELKDKPEGELTHLRKLLNVVYDNYVKKNGPLSSQSNAAALAGDPDAPLLVSLERKFSKGNKAKGIEPFAEKAPIFNRRMLRPAEVPTSVSDPKEALYISLNEKGRIDFERMGELTGRSPEQLQGDLAGLVYQDPHTKIWQTAEEYLSGSVRTKLKQAQAIAKIEPQYKANVEALEKVQPEDIPPGQIRALMGVTWVPLDVYSQFATEMLGVNRPVQVKYVGGNWFVDTGYGNPMSAQKWSTARVGAVELLNDNLNMRRTKVMDRSSDGSTTVNPNETKAARARQMEIQDHFEKWLFEDTKRGDQLVRLYNDTQNDLRLRTYEGAHLTLPGMARDAAVVRSGDLDPHQKAAVWRQIVQPNVLLAHAVGAGKTFEAIAGGMELKRLGLIRRPMYVVPNATLTGWQQQFSALYPQARVLVFGEKDLAKENRKRVMAQIATGDWDAVVVPHSSFQFLATGEDIFNQHYNKLATELEEQIMEAQQAGMDTRMIKRMEKSKERLLTSLKDKRKADTKDQTVTWEQLGIDQLFVDESHEYKKLGFATKQGNVAGIDQNGNQKTFDLLMKLRHTQTHGRGAVFMSGTPVTNTMGELYSIMKYLIEPELEARGIGKFDEWAANFGRTVDVFEPKVEGGGYQMKARFAQFVNLPELAQLFRSFADVVTSDMIDIPRPTIVGGKRQAIEQQLTDEQEDYLEGLRARAKGIRDDPRGSLPDNMLAVYGDAAKMAMDVRMVRPGAPDDPHGRLNAAADRIHELWEASTPVKGTQLVMSDLGKPAEAGGSKDFSAYDELINKMVERGIPRDQIAHIYQAKNKAQRTKIFQDVNDGKIRVLLGSTQKMGVGVNVQQRLYAMHHLDVPHRPSDLEQREGRILRQGNENPEVHIYYYVTKGSLDEAKFSNVVRKAKFINQVMQGKSEVREAEDVGGMVPSLEMFQAMASGDPRVMQKMETDAEVDRLSGVYSGWKNQQYKLRTELQQIPGRIQYATRGIEAINRNMAIRDKAGDTWTVGKQKFAGEKISKDVTDALRKEAAKVLDKKGTDVEIGTAFGLPLLASATNGILKIEVGDTAAVTILPDELPSADFYRRIKNRAESFEEDIAQKQQIIERSKKEEKNLSGSIEDVWPYTQKFQELAEKQQRLIKDLGADKGDDAAIAAGEGGEIVDKSVEAQEPETDEDEENAPEGGEEEPTRESRELTQSASGLTGVHASYRNGILWVNSAGMDKIIAATNNRGTVRGMYIPAYRVRDLAIGLNAGPEIKAELKGHNGPLTVVRMDPNESISKVKTTARHELFHASEEWAGGGSRGKALLRNPLAKWARINLDKKGYDTASDAVMFSEIGAHLASGPIGWETMGLDRDEAKSLFETYLDLLGDATLKRLDSIAPQLKEELYAARAIRATETELGRTRSESYEGTGGSQEERPVQSSLRSDVPEGGESEEDKPLGLRPENAGERGAAPLDFLTLGASKFIEKDVLPTLANAARYIGQSRADIRKVIAPASRGPEAQEAALTVRQRAADLARATDRAAAALEVAHKYFETKTFDENLDFIDKIETGQSQGNGQLQGIADTMRQILDDRRDQVQALGTGKLENFYEDYFPHIWKKPDAASKKFMEWFAKRPMEGSKSFLKKRTIPTIKDGVDMGLEPESSNPVDLVLGKIREMDKYLFAHRALDDLKHTGVLKYVKATEKAPEGYRKIEDKVAMVYEGKTAQGSLAIRGQYWAPEPAATIINNYLSPGLRKYASFRAYMGLANILNQFQLGWSAYHLGFTSFDAAVSRVALGIMQAANGQPIKGLATAATAPIAPFTGIMQGDKLLKEWYKPGTQGAEIGNLVDAMMLAGGRARMDKFYQTQVTKKMMEALRQGNVWGAALRAPFALTEQAARPIMEYIVPRQKMAVFADLAREELAKFDTHKDEGKLREALAKAWDSVDNRMGQLVYDNLFWNKAVKDLSMASVRSVGWNVGTIREILGGGADTVKAAGDALRGKPPEMTTRMAYILALPLVAGIAGGLIHYLATGQTPDETKDWFFPRRGPQGTPGWNKRMSLPSYVKDVVHYAHDPYGAVRGKVHPALEMIMEMLSNEDYFGRHIRNSNDPLVKQMEEEAAHVGQTLEPMAVRPLLAPNKNGQGTTAEKILPFVGITDAPKYITNPNAKTGTRR